MLCEVSAQVISFFIQVDASHVVETYAVCLPCLIEHHHVLEMEELPAHAKKRTPKTNKKASIRQENKLAEAIGGRRQKGSGNTPFAKGDVWKEGELRGEAKQTKAKSYRVTRAELDKIRQECAYGEEPFLALWFCSHSWKPEDKWVLVPEEVWRKLRDGK